MTQEEKSLYKIRLEKLQQDFKDIKNKFAKKYKKSFTPEQTLVYNLVNGARENVQFSVRGLTVTLHKGNKEYGLKHILLRHFCEGCKGEVKAIDILNISNIIAKGEELQEYEITNDGNMGFKQKKNKDIYKIILKKKASVYVILA